MSNDIEKDSEVEEGLGTIEKEKNVDEEEDTVYEED